MTCSGQLLTRIEASEALTRLQKAAETGDWAELKPEEAQEAAALLVDSAARIRDLEAQLAAQAEALAEYHSAGQALKEAHERLSVIPGAADMTDEQFDAADDLARAEVAKAEQRHTVAVSNLWALLGAQS